MAYSWDQMRIPIINLDSNKEYLNAASKAEPEIDKNYFIKCNAEELSGNGEVINHKGYKGLDAVVSEHFLLSGYSPIKDKQEKIVEEIAKVLKPNGYLVLENATKCEHLISIDINVGLNNLNYYFKLVKDESKPKEHFYVYQKKGASKC